MTTHRLALLTLATVTLLSLLSATRTSAHEPHPGLQFSIGIDGVEGCNTRNGEATCTIPQGSTFVLEVHLARLPDDIPSYGGFDLYLEHAGVAPLEDASNDSWPDCSFPAAFYGDGFIGFGCAIGLPPAGPSTYAGAIGTNSFVCEQSGSLALVHSAGDKTDLIETVSENAEGISESIIHSEGDGARETLNITCGAPPTPTEAPTATPPLVLPITGHGQTTAGHPPSGLFAGLLGAAAAALGALLLRRRTYQRPPTP